MNRMRQFTFLIAVVAIATGCVQTRPLMSHAHIGHALTTWHDTPGNQGLYTVAAKELDFAIAAADQAIASSAESTPVQRHLDNAMHALNPDLQPFGKGLDYGAIRALAGAIEHLEYAANSDDASDNFVGSVVSLVDQGDLVVARMRHAQDLIAKFDPQEPAIDLQLLQIQRQLMAAKFGEPESGAIEGSMARGDRGLVHISAELSDMLARESDPGYEPVPRRYVLGLVRLPSGLWGYRLAKTSYRNTGYSY